MKTVMASESLRGDKKSNFTQASILVTGWLLLQVLFFFKFGIVTDLESATYISAAKYLIATGHYPSGNFLFYSVQIFLDAFCIKAGISYVAVVILQLVLNGLSVIFFYKLIDKTTGSNKVAFAFTLLFLSMFYYHLYNVYLFTESIYFSLGILFTYFLFSIKYPSYKNIGLAICFIILLSITRPTGIFFFPAAFLYIIFKFFVKKAWVISGVSVVACLLIFYFLVNYAMSSGGALNFLLPYLDERIICGVPTLAIPHTIEMTGNPNSIQGLWYIMTHYTGLFVSLALKRFIAFFGMYRPYYSVFHNVYIIVSFLLVYILMLLSIKKLFSQFLPMTIYCSIIILLFTVTVVLSCDEWHNRFIFGLWTLFVLMASTFFKQKQMKTD